MPTGTLDSTKVEVASTGAVYLAPLGTTLPTDSSTALAAAYTNVGYLSEDGITESPDEDTNEIQAWQNGDVVRTVQTSHSISYSFTMIETNEYSLKAYYGNYTAGGWKINGAQLPRQVLVIETIDAGKLRRRVAQVAQVTERGDVELTNSEATGYEVTFTCYPGTDGVTKVNIFAPYTLP
jgi:hypothetical protein